jgi:hypothetical protein
MSGKKIKIALCLSGDPRNDTYLFPYIYKHFLSNPTFEVDIYIHTWKNFESLDLYKPKKCLIEYNQEYKICENILSQIPNLNKVKLLDAHNGNNTILMFYSFNKCFNLIKEKYDLYIKLRFDSYIPLSTNLSPFIKDVLENTYDIFIPKGDNESKHWEYLGVLKGYNDRIAIGNYKAFQAYSNTFFQFPKIVSELSQWFSHEILFHSLNSSNLKIHTPSFLTGILRDVNKKVNFYGETYSI